MTVASQVKQSLSSIKSIQASLSSLSTRSKNEQAVNAFQETMTMIDEVKKDLNHRIGELEQEEEQYKGF